MTTVHYVLLGKFTLSMFTSVLADFQSAVEGIKRVGEEGMDGEIAGESYRFSRKQTKTANSRREGIGAAHKQLLEPPC